MRQHAGICVAPVIHTLHHPAICSMRSSLFKILLVAVIAVALVWLLVGRPDRAAELQTLKRQLAAEADLRSQALTFAMSKYRQATVLLARTDIVAAIKNGSADQNSLDRLFYLQALSGVTATHVLLKGQQQAVPVLNAPTQVQQSKHWRDGVALAFQGSLGRAFYNDSNGRPNYVFFTPIPSDSPQTQAILIVSIDLGLIRDSWQVSGNHIALHSTDNEIWFDNDISAPNNAVTISRPHNPMGAVLKISTKPPSWLGSWTLRSLIMSLLFVLIGVLTFSLLERRRFLAELAQQRASEAQRLEHEVTQRTDQLEKVQKQLLLTEKLALLGQMSASISHEINQPLAAIKNYASSARRQFERSDTTRLQSNLQNIEQLCDRVARIVVNLRSFAGSDSSPVRSTDLQEVINDALSEFHIRFPEAKHCTIADTTDQELSVMAGRVRLLQVLANLLTNAWYACRHQPAPEIRLQVKQSSHAIEITLHDNGPGIDTEISEQVFDAFVTKRDHATGLGLGLTISRSFIESMDGELRVAYSGPQGTGFVIKLARA
jgi:C4-dicarboxylate-specific signal transduction histidine kinase